MIIIQFINADFLLLYFVELSEISQFLKHYQQSFSHLNAVLFFAANKIKIIAC